MMLLLAAVAVLAGLCLLAGSSSLALANRPAARRHRRGRRRPRPRRASVPGQRAFPQTLTTAIQRLEASNEQLRAVTERHERLVAQLTALETTAARLLDDIALLPPGESAQPGSASQAQGAAPAGTHSSSSAPAGEREESDRAARPHPSTWPPCRDPSALREGARLDQPDSPTVHLQASRSPLRVVIVAMAAVSAALTIGIALFGDGGAMRVRPPRTPSPPGPVQQAQALAALGDYEAAARLYGQGLQVAPDDVSLRYALGVVLSRLNRWQETEEAFQYVVRHGNPDADEVKLARRWLVHRGVLAPSVTFSGGPPTSDPSASTGVVQVKATWRDLGPNGPLVTLRISLQGLSGAALGRRYSRRVALSDVARFEHLASGTYRLLGRVEGGALLWEQTVDVTEGRELTLVLSKDNSSNPTAPLVE